MLLDEAAVGVWAPRTAAAVLERVDHLVGELAVTPEQARLLRQALVGLRQQALGDPTEQDGLRLFVHYPLLVHAAVSGDDAPALPLAAATSLLFLGIDIFDDLADSDLPEHWNGTPPSRINLAAATLLSALPQLAIDALGTSAAVRADLQRIVADGLLRMSAGQQEDLGQAGAVAPEPADVEASVMAKSGEEIAMFGLLAARLAGAPPRLSEAYTEIGRAIGVAAQIASDCYDLFTAARSKDLANGSRTLPIAFHLQHLDGAPRKAFLALIDAARTEPAARDEIRGKLRASGALRKSAVVVELWCQRAHRLLREARPLEPAGERIEHLIESVSFFAPPSDSSIERAEETACLGSVAQRSGRVGG